ncbi:MAG TPA: hypothetical protein VGI95_15770 [Caulobacteraceae bacterium]|jgi:hypothetical protein
MRLSTVALLACTSISLSACITPDHAEPPAHAAAAAAPPPAAVVTPTRQVAANDPDQMVCIRAENTGSRLPGPKECHTRVEWARIHANGLDTLGIANTASLPRTDEGSATGR